MSARPIAAAAGSVTGRHVLLALLAFFCVTIGVNAVFIYFAVTTFSGIETENAYRRGLAYNARHRVAAAEAALGWTARLVVEERRPVLLLTDASGQSLGGLIVVAKAGRPSIDRFDRELGFHETNAGRYVADGALEPGAWIVAADVRDPSNRTLRIKERLWLSR